MKRITILAAFSFVMATAWTARGDDPPAATRAELKKLQGLWQYTPGGMQHRDGRQVVALPAPDGPCFFVAGDRLIWLDDEGKPSGRESKITMEVAADPKRITLTPVGEGDEKPVHGIYSATESGLRVHIGLDGGAAPRRFLELNKPAKGVDGEEWLASRKRLRGR